MKILEYIFDNVIPPLIVANLIFASFVIVTDGYTTIRVVAWLAAVAYVYLWLSPDSPLHAKD